MPKWNQITEEYLGGLTDPLSTVRPRSSGRPQCIAQRSGPASARPIVPSASSDAGRQLVSSEYAAGAVPTQRGHHVKQVCGRLAVRGLRSPDVRPPIEVRDIASDSNNGQATPGNIGQLTGNRLKYNTGAGDEGVYFVSVGGGETKVATVQKNKPSQAVFLIPTLLAGDYQIEVRARISGGTELRSGRLDAVSTVGTTRSATMVSPRPPSWIWHSPPTWAERLPSSWDRPPHSAWCDGTASRWSRRSIAV